MCSGVGWLQLYEGDMVWVRDLGGSKSPEDDAIRFYYISSYVYALCRTYCVLSCRTGGLLISRINVDLPN